MAKKKAPSEVKEDITFEPASSKKNRCDCCGCGCFRGKWGVKITSKYDSKPAMVCLACYSTFGGTTMSGTVRKFLDEKFPNLTKKWGESKDDGKGV